MSHNDELTHIPRTCAWGGGDWAIVFVPALLPGTDVRPPYPILCFLHGHGEARTAPNGAACHPLGVAAHRSPAYHAQRGSDVTKPFLVVCPQRQEPGRWTDQDADGVHGLLDYAIEHHSGDSDRIFLTGFSLGGDATLKIPHYKRGDRIRKLWALAIRRYCPGIGLFTSITGTTSKKEAAWMLIFRPGTSRRLSGVDSASTASEITLGPACSLMDKRRSTGGSWHNSGRRSHRPS